LATCNQALAGAVVFHFAPWAPNEPFAQRLAENLVQFIACVHDLYPLARARLAADAVATISVPISARQPEIDFGIVIRGVHGALP
jgi:hypothetical protein